MSGGSDVRWSVHGPFMVLQLISAAPYRRVSLQVKKWKKKDIAHFSISDVTHTFQNSSLVGTCCLPCGSCMCVLMRSGLFLQWYSS